MKQIIEKPEDITDEKATQIDQAVMKAELVDALKPEDSLANCLSKCPYPKVQLDDRWSYLYP